MSSSQQAKEKHRALGQAVLLCLLFAAIMPPAATAADPFYTDLLRRGERAYERGDLTSAADDLRIACFGFLDEPPLLAEGLARLALVQAALDDQENYLKTFQRITELEERFEAYRQARLPRELRAAFEEEAVRRVPPDLLARAAAFEHLARMQPQVRLSQLSGRQKRQELESLLAGDPDNPNYLMHLAEIELEDKRTRRAIGYLDRLLTLRPQDDRAICLRGQAYAQARDCNQAVADLATCSKTHADARLAGDHLGCLVKLKQWERSESFLEQLPAGLRTDLTISGLEARVQRARARQPPQQQVGSQSATAGPTDDESAGEPIPADRTRLVELRRTLDRVSRVEELDHALRTAQALATRYPEWREAQFLAAEMAYRAGRWQEAVKFFRRGGDASGERGDLVFYYAVALYETGERQAAADTLQRVLASLERTPFVQTYVERILADVPDTR